MCLALEQSAAKQEGSCPVRLRFASHSDREEVLVCRELVGARPSCLKTGLSVLAIDHTSVLFCSVSDPG